MNYKQYIKNQRLRFWILKILCFIPDAYMLKLQYWIKLSRKLNLRDPQRYTEKLQWYKTCYRNMLMVQCVDKYEVRKFVESKELRSILNELYGVYDKAEYIDFESLPQQFVIKTTDGGGGENVLICLDKTELDIPATIHKVNSWLNRKDINAGREWAYTGISKSRIVVEKYLINKDNPEAGIQDYKFFCFQGKVYYIVYDADRYIGHKRNFYDTHWNYLAVGSDCPTIGDVIPRPSGLEDMIKVAEKLSKDFPHVRVDLYYIDERVIFGEMTFYPWSGYVQFLPDRFDYLLGEKFFTNQK